MKKLCKFNLAIAKILFAFVLISASCNQPKTASNSPIRPAEITVSAAASLQDAFREIGEMYEKQTGVKVNFNFASSGVLQKQIEQGAPADVFASAGMQQMEELCNKNLLVAEPSCSTNFVRNEIVLIVPASGELRNGDFIEFLKNKNIKLAIGNPRTVPAGQYAQQSLEHLGVWGKVQSQLIFAEDVRQVLDYVSRGEVDAGIVYASDVRAANGKVIKLAQAPENSHEPIFYPIAVLKNSHEQQAALKFLLFVRRAEGQQILEKYGFIGLE